MVETLERASLGTTMPNLNQSIVASIPFPLPPLDEQHRLAAILDQAAKLRLSRRQVLNRLNGLVQALFSDMFDEALNGELTPLSSLVAEFRYGTSVKSTETGHAVLRIPNVAGGLLDLQDLKFVNLDDAELERLRLTDGDILFVRTNGNPKYVGRCAVFDAEPFQQAGLAADPVVYASYLIRARLTDALVPKFAAVYLNGIGRSQLRRNSKTSAGQYNINIEGLGGVLVPTPAVAEQRDFVRRVAAIESTSRLNSRALAELDTLFAALQSRAFSGQL
jgi:type I restriction enzyme, S subunit